MNTTTINVESEITNELTPMMAFVFYQDNIGINAATQHSINDDQLSPGKPVSVIQIQNSLDRLTQTKSDQVSTKRLTNPFVLFEDSRLLMWYKPSIIAPMWFALGATKLKNTVRWPNLIFVFDKSKRQLKIGALATGARPHERTKVYHPPLMNISDDLSLCQGSARIPQKVSADNLEAIEQTLYHSWFSHANCRKLIKGIVNNKALAKWWIDNGRQRVLASDLHPWGRVSELLGAQ